VTMFPASPWQVTKEAEVNSLKQTLSSRL